MWVGKFLIAVLLYIGLGFAYGAQEDDIKAIIYNIESDSGAFSIELIEPITSLGQLYQEQQRYEDAIREYRRAVSLLHIHEGIYTINQVPILERVAENLLSMNRITEAEGQYTNAAWIYWRNGIYNKEQYLHLKSRFWEKVHMIHH